MEERRTTPTLRLEIDRLRLDEEWANQPLMVHEWGLEAADAQLRLDRAKTNFDIVSADLSNDVRKNPGDYGIKDKLTEKMIEAAVTADPKYRAAADKINTARHDLEYARSAVNALEHRKRALTLMVELFVKDYYSEMTVNMNSEEAANWQKQRVRGGGRQRLERQREDRESDDAG